MAVLMLEISRSFEFQAAHHLPNTPAEHRCHRLHGHTWNVTIAVTGPIDPVLAWIVDYANLDAVFQATVFEELDHSLLNDKIPNPTTESIAGWIYKRMHVAMVGDGVRIVRVEVAEGSRNRCVLRIDAPGERTGGETP